MQHDRLVSPDVLTIQLIIEVLEHIAQYIKSGHEMTALELLSVVRGELDDVQQEMKIRLMQESPFLWEGVPTAKMLSPDLTGADQ